jgi:hypothetical protein
MQAGESYLEMAFYFRTSMRVIQSGTMFGDVAIIMAAS